MGKKTWREKLYSSGDLPKVERLEGKAAAKWGEVLMAIPAPLEVYEIMSGVSYGKLLTASEIRQIIAAKHNADIGCPLTTGIFTGISANAAEEIAAIEGKDPIPYWRTLRAKGELNEKFPGGIQAQILKLEAEGHTIIRKGSRFFVKDFADQLDTSLMQ